MGHPPETLVRNTERKEPFDARSEGQLKLDVQGQDRDPAVDLFDARGELPEPDACISHEQPPSLDVRGDEFRADLGARLA